MLTKEQINFLNQYTTRDWGYGGPNVWEETDEGVNVFGSVYFPEGKYKKMPVKFRTVYSNFSCANNELETLEGCPVDVGRIFRCDNNKLKTLEGCPKRCSEFSCRMNPIETYSALKGVVARWVWVSSPEGVGFDGLWNNPLDIYNYCSEQQVCFAQDSNNGLSDAEIGARCNLYALASLVKAKY